MGAVHGKTLRFFQLKKICREISPCEAEAPQLDKWLNRHFTGSTYLDLRIMILENGTITVRGLRPTEQDLAAFPPEPLFKP